MFTKAFRPLLAAAAICVLAAPAVGQGFSDSYQFIQAVKERDGAKVESLLATPGTMVNTRDRDTGNSAIHIVTLDRNPTWMRYLVGKGARVDAQNDKGETALTLASQMGWFDGVQTLLNLRANVDLANGRGETPLILAVQKRDLPLVRLLLASGADPRKNDRVAGLSALDYAKRDGRSPAIVKMLEDTKVTPKREVAGPSF